jgi:alpha-1,6-mannosyltransferase
MYSWIHVLLATACAVAAWYSLSRDPDQYAIAWARRSTSRA